jgi:hypothetical protein
VSGNAVPNVTDAENGVPENDPLLIPFVLVFSPALPPPPFIAYDAVKAYDADVAFTALEILPLKYEADTAVVAYDALNILPVIIPVTVNEPVTVNPLVNLPLPLTSKIYAGDIVPIPILPPNGFNRISSAG